MKRNHDEASSPFSLQDSKQRKIQTNKPVLPSPTKLNTKAFSSSSSSSYSSMNSSSLPFPPYPNTENPSMVTLPSASSIMKELSVSQNTQKVNSTPLQPISNSSSSSSSSSNLPSIGDADARKQKQKHAMDFLYKVRDHYASTPRVYSEFLEIMKGFKSGSIETPEVISRVQELFRGNGYLVEEFNQFLPPGFQIGTEKTVPSTRTTTETTGNTPTNEADLEQARAYVRKVKTRFSNHPNIYKEFLDILHNYYSKQHTIDNVLAQISELFKDHPDLLEQFKNFIPKGVNSQKPSTPPSVPPTVTSKKPRQEKKKAKTDKVKTTKKDEKRDERKHKKEEKKKTQEKKIEQGFYKEFDFFHEVKNRVKSRLIYHELLESIQLYNQNILNKAEMVFLGKYLLKPHTDLFEWFKKFINYEDDEEYLERTYIPVDKTVFKDEDDLTDLIEDVSSAIKAMEELLAQSEEKKIRMNIGKLGAKHLKLIEIMYGYSGPEIIDGLWRNSSQVAPIVLTRFKKKKQEMIEMRDQLREESKNKMDSVPKQEKAVERHSPEKLSNFPPEEKSPFTENIQNENEGEEPTYEQKLSEEKNDGMDVETNVESTKQDEKEISQNEEQNVTHQAESPLKEMDDVEKTEAIDGDGEKKDEVLDNKENEINGEAQTQARTEENQLKDEQNNETDKNTSEQNISTENTQEPGQILQEGQESNP